MAEDNPLNVPETSSYSDPIYDRLEGVVNFLGRKWWLLVIVAAASAAGGIAVRNLAASPEAASAGAYVQARSDLDALVEVANDTSITDEFRAHACLSAAQLALESGDMDGANAFLSQGAGLAQQAGNSELQLAIDASKGAVAETAADWDGARAAYSSVMQRTSQTNHPGLNLAATLGAARTELSAAAESKDSAEALRMRQEARGLLEFAISATPNIDYGMYPIHVEANAESQNRYAGMMKQMQGETPALYQDPYRGQPGEVDLGAAARFLLMDLDRRYPEVNGSAAAVSAEEASAPVEEAVESSAEATASETAPE